jgi:hypothetical protein
MSVREKVIHRRRERHEAKPGPISARSSLAKLLSTHRGEQLRHRDAQQSVDHFLSRAAAVRASS